jgi:hypothetical protein
MLRKENPAAVVLREEQNDCADPDPSGQLGMTDKHFE